MDSKIDAEALNIQELIKQEFSKPNYLIEKEEVYTAIYFSSCGIYDKEDVEDFQSKIIGKNRFEYYGTRIEKATKHIFLRDIAKKWYFNGISDELNSIEKVLEFLKEETKGSKIITVGASAGGYAAVLFGILLNAEYIFSFSGQYSLTGYDWLIDLYKDRVNNKYFDLTNLIKESDIPIFYMFPTGFERDIKQFNLVKDLDNVHLIKLKSSTHGIPVTKDTLRVIMNSDLAALKQMYNYKNQAISEVGFLNEHFGVKKALTKIVKKNASCIAGKFKHKPKND